VVCARTGSSKMKVSGIDLAKLDSGCLADHFLALNAICAFLFSPFLLQ
jgi:hypothetical protein